MSYSQNQLMFTKSIYFMFYILYIYNIYQIGEIYVYTKNASWY